MNRFKNILAVCSDTLGGDDVIGQASALASANGARLTLVSMSRGWEPPAWRDEQLKRLRRIASAIEADGVADVAIRVLDGTPAVAIVGEVIDRGHDIVIMCRDIDDSLGDRLVGGTASRMLRNCPVPVWLLSPGLKVPYKRILAVVDNRDGATDAESRGLDIKILEIASSLAAVHGAELHIANPWEVEGLDYDTMRSEMRPKDREALVARHKGKRLVALGELLNSISGRGIDYQIHMPRLPAFRAISDLTSELSIDVMVLKADDVSHLSFLFGGSLAEGLLKSVACSTLAISPDGLAGSYALQAPAPSEVSRRVAV
jgi:nucleotide-binding universal stress UspA family protein